MRIATWNVENLFSPGTDGGPESAMEFEAKADALAAVIERMDPDILALQEVGDRRALDRVLERAGGSWHVELATPDRRGIGVAIAARTPLSQMREVTDFPTGIDPIQVDDTDTRIHQLGRAGLHAVVDTDLGAVHVLTCHLKSKLLTFPGGRFTPRDEHERTRFAAYALFRRTAESAAIRDAATAILDDGDDTTRLVVLGDLNDTVDAQTTQILSGPPGSEIGTTGYDKPDAGDRQRLWNLAPRIPAAQRFSRIYRGRGELIDHILVSHNLVDHIADGAVTTDAAGTTNSIDDDPNRRRSNDASDHRPVLATTT
ncbi:endonuclease/exonuclease/phosphatase family protein [Gordonia sp. NPDC058843]|uniref:endonuclease/exonuclease/phosphatase family protein n=1 Tax=Gordonia sp. NPDC058843 TaxID=3346648 RepID=UPI0036CC421C